MKPMGENEVLHLGNTIHDWRVIAICLRHAADAHPAKTARDEFNQLAARIEAHLPSNDGAPK